MPQQDANSHEQKIQLVKQKNKSQLLIGEKLKFSQHFLGFFF